MTVFDYKKTIQSLMTPEIVSALGALREYKGKQAFYYQVQPDVLQKLSEVSKIQSTEASNRIENISTTNKRLRELMSEKTTPRNRDEREIAGYRYVLNLIHEKYEAIPVSPSVILQLHRDLYRYENYSFAGHWKDSDNVIAEETLNGEKIVRFKPPSAAGTPSAVETLCGEYNSLITTDVYDKFLLAALFTFDFVSIHPFNDGNGRMSRLLTLLLLYKSGYTVGKYISTEKKIEESKETYYEALAASSVGWHEGKNDYVPFVTYLLGVVISCYKELEERFNLIFKHPNNTEVIKAFFDSLLGQATKQEIMDANPSISKSTINRVLQSLQAEGYIEKVGAARNTAYRKSISFK